VNESRTPWRAVTHDWPSVVDLGHLARIRQDPATFAPGGVRHLILEVVAYAAEEGPEWLCHDLKVRRPSPVPAYRQ
jgi:topoisomerase-4 subunit B